MMKTALALAISIWIGWGGGALVDETVPEFWTVWVTFGIALMLTTAVYVHSRRAHVTRPSN